MTMTSHILRRVIEEGKYIVNKKATIRGTADFFGISKSTVHRDMKVILPEIDSILAQRVQEVIQYNKSQRHIRGGEATKKRNFMGGKKKSNSSHGTVTALRGA